MLNATPNRIERFFEQSTNTIESVLLMLATRFGPWLAPIGPAYFVGRAAHNHLEAHWLIAVCMALAVEAVGIAATHTALKCWTWNGGKRKIDPTAPTTLMVWLSLVYFASALALSILVEVYPASATYAPAVFIGLAGVGYVTIAVSIRLTGWQSERTAEKQIKSAHTELADLAASVKNMAVERDKLTNEIASLKAQKHKNGASNGTNDGISPITGASIDTANNGKKAQIDARRDRILCFIQDGKSDPEIRQIEEISQATLRRDKAVLNGALQGVK